MQIRSQVLDELLKQQGNVLCVNMCALKKERVNVLTSLNLCAEWWNYIMHRDYRKELIRSKTLWCVSESSLELFDLTQGPDSFESVHQKYYIDLFTD